MTQFLIIWLLGGLCSIAFNLYIAPPDKKHIKVNELHIIFVMMMFSWIYLAIDAFSYYFDKVDEEKILFDFRPKEEREKDDRKD